MLMDDVLCCALHPSGTLLAVGMRDKLRIFSIAMVRCLWVAHKHGCPNISMSILYAMMSFGLVGFVGQITVVERRLK